MDIEEYRTKHIALLGIQCQILKRICESLELKNLIAPVKKEMEKQTNQIRSEHISGVNLEAQEVALIDEEITQEDVFMDLIEVTVEAQTPAALLVTKKGYQKWVPKSLILENQFVFGKLKKGHYLEAIILTPQGEKWFHDKKSWEVYRVL